MDTPCGATPASHRTLAAAGGPWTCGSGEKLPDAVPDRFDLASNPVLCLGPDLLQLSENLVERALDLLESVFQLAADLFDLSGPPSIAHLATGGLPEVVAHGETGLLTPPFDTTSMAEAVAALLADPERHRRMAEAARHSATTRFAREPALNRYEAYYEKILR